ncbi:unnamed protein product [Closterium sp. Yama58-4]|nr:unnamed protein product [Closterium sp. Yama58-4]
MARLLALHLAASVILALLCCSEAVRLVPSASTATASTATASNVTSSKPSGVQRFHMYLILGTQWKLKDKPKPGEVIEFENAGIVPRKDLYEFRSKAAYDNCNFKVAGKLHDFSTIGAIYEYTVPYSAINGHLYFAASPWMCKHLGLKFQIPVEEYSPGGR